MCEPGFVYIFSEEKCKPCQTFNCGNWDYSLMNCEKCKPNYGKNDDD